jgi:hypothetical protein
MYPIIHLYRVFLPPDAVKQLAPEPPKPPYAAPPRPRAPSEKVLKDQARSLSQYGFNKLVTVGEEYALHVGDWKLAFGDVLAAYALAISQVDTTLKDAEREQEREAAWAAFVLSLCTAGAMRFLGAYVQYTFLPRVFAGKEKLVPVNLSSWVYQPVTVGEISRQSAAAFGGLAQDLGNHFGRLLATASKESAGQQMHTIGGLEVLRSAFNRMVEEAAALVNGELKNAKNWMNEREEFGMEWIRYCGGDAERARREIGDHINKLRKHWAVYWEFYGKKPQPIALGPLAHQYERAIWVGHVHSALYGQLRSVSAEAHIAEVRRRSRGEGMLGRGEGPKAKIGVRIPNAIIARLKHLNVVLAETDRGAVDQMTRTASEGAPTPQVAIDDKFDTLGEYDSMKAWVDSALPRMREEASKRFFPEAAPREIKPI